MMTWGAPFIIISLAVIGLYFSETFSDPPPPPTLGDGWWGRGDRQKITKEDESIRKFAIKISNDTLSDLKTRLRNTRYFEGIEGTKSHYGVRPEYMRTVVRYWLDKYDFKAQEKYFNKYDHYTTTIEGIAIHFVHVKPTLKSGQKSKPLLLIHGWPGSFYEFYKMLPLLTDPLNHYGSEEDIFEVICPSIPGYGYSEAAHKTGHSLTDSPVGLAAYILEKFSTLTNQTWRDLDDGGLNDGWQMDDLLNNIMIYWLNGNMASATRFYNENFEFLFDTRGCIIKVPSGIADFPDEIIFGRVPEAWSRYRFTNLLQYTTMPRGGHFAAMEEPELLAEDIRLFVRKVERL